MSFSAAKFNPNAFGQLAYYKDTTVTLATLTASGFFNSISEQVTAIVSATSAWLVYLEGSDNAALYKFAVSGSTVTVAAIVNATDIALARGWALVGNSAGVAAPVNISAAGTILKGDGTDAGAFARGAANTVLKVNAGGTDIEYGTLLDANCNASMALAVSKLAAGTAGQVLLNNATPTPTWTTFSQDATVDGTGAITVASAQGNFNMGAGGSGNVVKSGITSGSGAHAVPVTGSIHEVTTTGTGDALTLANGTNGQRLTIMYVAEGAGSDTAVLTPATLAGGTTITFNALGDTADLTYLTNGGWYMHGGTAAIA